MSISELIHFLPLLPTFFSLWCSLIHVKAKTTEKHERSARKFLVQNEKGSTQNLRKKKPSR